MFQANQYDAFDSELDEGPNSAVAFNGQLINYCATNKSSQETSDAETEIDDKRSRNISIFLTRSPKVFQQRNLLSADTSDKVSMDCHLNRLKQTQPRRHAKKELSQEHGRIGFPPMKLLVMLVPLHTCLLLFVHNRPTSNSNCLCEDLRSACDREHTKVLELEAEVLKQQKMVIESEKRVNPTSGASKTVPKRAPRNHSSLPAKSANARRVEAHHRTLNKKNRVDSNLLVKHSVSVSNLNNVSDGINKSLVFANPNDCLVMCDDSVNVKPHQTKRLKRQPKKEWKPIKNVGKPIKRVWKPISKPVANSKPQWKPTEKGISHYREVNHLTRSWNQLICQ
ncbi:hypothetical protein Tco_1345000 [Tanacetum coccineum]